jgi:orotidine 5'-phosphate decarboxylase subfamily 1
MKNFTYQQRAQQTQHHLAQRLLNLMAEKQTNLALSADVTTKKELLALADTIGPDICILKTHIDVIKDFDEDLIDQLQRLAIRHNFLSFEDRKFADIGHTVQLQYSKGIYHIAEWADIINAHILPGPGIIEGLKAIGLPQQRGLLLIAEMSSKDNLFDQNYVNATLEMAKQHKDFVFGFIAQNRLLDDPDFIYMTPGVNLEANGDHLGQNYLHPTKVILENNTDIIIVGRGIYKAPNPKAAAHEFRALGWQAYLQRCKI